MRISFIIIFLFSNLYSYTDNDIDGVDDNIDKCLNTSFDDIVDKYGCAINKSYNGTANIEFTYILQNTTTQTNTIKNIYLNYDYNNITTSISKGIYTNNTNYYTDTYITISNNLFYKDFLLIPSFAIKIANGDNEISTNINDYIISLQLDKIINENFTYNLSSSYTFVGNNNNTNYKNYLNNNVGISYLNNLSITYTNNGSTNTLLNAYENIELSYTYTISNKLYAKMKFNQSLLDSNTNDTSLSIGYNFE